jgi:hypothetical protein
MSSFLGPVHDWWLVLNRLHLISKLAATVLPALFFTGFYSNLSYAAALPMDSVWLQCQGEMKYSRGTLVDIDRTFVWSALKKQMFEYNQGVATEMQMVSVSETTIVLFQENDTNSINPDIKTRRRQSIDRVSLTYFETDSTTSTGYFDNGYAAIQCQKISPLKTAKAGCHFETRQRPTGGETVTGVGGFKFGYGTSASPDDACDTATTDAARKVEASCKGARMRPVADKSEVTNQTATLDQDAEPAIQCQVKAHYHCVTETSVDEQVELCPQL